MLEEVRELEQREVLGGAQVDQPEEVVCVRPLEAQQLPHDVHEGVRRDRSPPLRVQRVEPRLVKIIMAREQDGRELR